MPTILIAHRDIAFAERLADELRGGGYHVIVHHEPPPPGAHCICCHRGYCPLAEGADLVIYDPSLTVPDPYDQRDCLAVASALAHPEVPVLLAWSPAHVTDAGTLRAIRLAAPWIHMAAPQAAGLLQQVRTLLTAAAAPAG